MNRRLISKAISDIDDAFIAESMSSPVEKTDHAPERTSKMDKNENKRVSVSLRKVMGLILAACLIFSLAVTAYAADIGGIRRIIQIWRYGDQTTAILDIQDGQYTLSNEDGSPIMSGGGVAIEPDGPERPLTEEEIIEHLDQPDLLHKEDGTVWVFYHGQKFEITEEMFDTDGICYLQLRDGNDVLYATIERNGGMATSPTAYVQPWKFGTTNE